MIYYPPAVLKLFKIQMRFFFRFLIFKPQIEKMTMPIFLFKLMDFMSRQNVYLSTIPIGSVFLRLLHTNKQTDKPSFIDCGVIQILT